MNAWQCVRAASLAMFLFSSIAPVEAQQATNDAPPAPFDWSLLPPHVTGQTPSNEVAPFTLPGTPPAPRSAAPRAGSHTAAAPKKPAKQPSPGQVRTAEYQQQSPRQPVGQQAKPAGGAKPAYYYYPATAENTSKSQVQQASHQRNVASPKFFRVSSEALQQSQPKIRQASHRHTRPYYAPAPSHGCDCPTCAAAEPGCEPTCEPSCGPPSCDGCGSCAECDAWIENDCWEHRKPPYRGIRCRTWCWSQDLSISAGLHTFESPADQGINGNYGLSYSLNWAMPVWHRLGIGAQLGYRGLSADPAGEPISGAAGNARQQDFVTVGFFHRPTPRNCWQYGVVWDWLSDDYFVPMELSQLRFELSRHFGCHELGVWGATTLEDDVQTFNAVAHNWETHDQLNIFWRMQHARGVYTRIWGGVTDDGDGLVGGDIDVPLNRFFAFEANAQFLLPTEGQAANAFSQEAWGTSLNVVLYPGGRALDTHRSRYAPLFDVADNASMLLNRLAP